VIPGNDDAMRAIELYAGGVADAVIEGRSTIPEVPVGEDEFVELDEEGRPRPKSGPKRRIAPAKKKTPVRRRPTAEPEPAVDAAAELAEADPEESPEAFMARREAARRKVPEATAAVAPAAVSEAAVAAASAGE
jgi:small subunit ribosomal protein S2